MDIPTEVRGLALCAGAGGIELGLRRVFGDRYYALAYCERDPYAQAALVARMEDASLDPAPVCDDVEEFDCALFADRVDILSSGFPCQPFSTAGKRQGVSDERWIWPAIARAIRFVRPRIVFLENVPDLTLGGIEHVLGDLALCGLDAEWDVFSASEVGAPHQRERIFILAWSLSDPSRELLRFATERDLRRKTERGDSESRDLGEPLVDADRRDGSERSKGHARKKRARRTESRRTDTSLGDAAGERRNRNRLRERSVSTQRRSELADPDAPPRLHDRGQQRDHAFRSSARPCWAWPPGPDDFESWRAYLALGAPEPAIRRSPHGLARQLDFRADRLRLCGNGTVPHQVEKAFKTLALRALDQA